MRKFVPKSTGWVWFFLAAFRPTGTKEKVSREIRPAQVFFIKKIAERFCYAREGQPEST